MDALEALRTRRSVRSYEPRPIDRADLETVIDAGRLAATARNEQPWEFVVVTDRDKRMKLAELAEYGKFIADAPACVVVLCANAKYYLEDGAAATQNILVAARALGLGTCWVAGDKKPYAAEICRIVGAPAECKLISLVAIGHARSIPDPPKRPLEEVLHWERY